MCGEKENINISSLGHISHLLITRYLLLSTTSYILTTNSDHTEHLTTDRNLPKTFSDRQRENILSTLTYLTSDDRNVPTP